MEVAHHPLHGNDCTANTCISENWSALMDRCLFITYTYSLNGLRTVVKVWEISASAQKQIKYMYRNLDWSERNLE